MQLAGLETVPSLLLHGRYGEHVLVLAVQKCPVVTVQSCIPQVQSSVFLIAPVVSVHAILEHVPAPVLVFTLFDASLTLMTLLQ